MPLNTTTIQQKAATILTIASGVITAVQGLHIVAAQTGTTDDLDTITDGYIDTIVAGNTYRPLLMITADTGDTITVKHSTGNIELVAGIDLTLTAGQWLLLFYDGTNWRNLKVFTPGAEITDELTALTHSAPGSPDYVIADLTNPGFGFTTLDEGLTVLSVIVNNAVRIKNLEDRLVAQGLLIDAD